MFISSVDRPKFYRIYKAYRMKISPSLHHFLHNVKKDEKGEVGIFKQNTLFPFSYDFKNSDKFVFFFPGAFNRAKGMPKFQRSKYFVDLPYNCISFFDPTHFLTSNPNFSIGWFQGTKKAFYGDLVGDLIKGIVDAWKIEYKNVLLFATSAGGVPAIHSACKLNNCKIFCGNIQTDITQYHKGAYKRLIRNIYGGMDEETMIKKYKRRLDIFDIDINFDIFYAQNYHDQFHYEKHFLPFKNKFSGEGKRFKSLIYHCEQTGHNPLSGEIEKDIVCGMLENRDIVALYEKHGLT